MEVGCGDGGEGRKPSRDCPYCPGCCCCGGGPPYAGLECPFAKPALQMEHQLGQGLLSEKITRVWWHAEGDTAYVLEGSHDSRRPQQHNYAPGGLIMASPGWVDSGACCLGGPGILGLCPGGPLG